MMTYHIVVHVCIEGLSNTQQYMGKRHVFNLYGY